MPKPLLRIVALFLVPCLVSDPALAASFQNQVLPAPLLFIEQALAPEPMSVPSRLGTPDTTSRVNHILTSNQAGKSARHSALRRRAFLGILGIGFAAAIAMPSAAVQSFVDTVLS